VGRTSREARRLVIRIGPIDYTLRAMTEVERAGVHKEHWGFNDEGQQEILLDPTPPARTQARLLIHEIIHGCYNATGDLANNAKLGEEDVCGYLDKQLTAVLLGNRWLFDVLEKAIHEDVRIV